MKTSEDKCVATRVALQLNVQKLKLEQQPASQKRESDIQEALSEQEEVAQEAPSDAKEETQEAPPDPEEEAQKVPSDPEVETEDKAGPVAVPTDLGGPIVSALRKLTISGNHSPIISPRTRSRRVYTGVEGEEFQSYLRRLRKSTRKA